MKILVTGCAGFLGSHLCDALISENHVVIGVDNMIGGDAENISNLIEFHNIDCCDFDRMRSIMDGVDVVVHTAATAHEGLSVFSPNIITKNIFQATVATVSAAASVGVKRFVFCSSMARYGNGTPPFKETDPTAPVDPYGIAKVAAEEVLKVVSEVHGMEWNIVVPHNIIGPRQKFSDPYRNVLSIMINRSLRGLPIYIYGDGEQVRCFSYIEECIKCMLPVIFNPDLTGEIINIGPDEGEVTINTLSEMVLREVGSNISPVHIDPRPQEVKYAVCSSDKARRLLGYVSVISLREAIKKTVDWIREKGPREFDYTFPIEISTEKTPKTWSERKM